MKVPPFAYRVFLYFWHAYYVRPSFGMRTTYVLLLALRTAYVCIISNLINQKIYKQFAACSGTWSLQMIIFGHCLVCFNCSLSTYHFSTTVKSAYKVLTGTIQICSL